MLTKKNLYISSFSLHFLPLSPFPHSLSISHIKICYILSQNVKYGIFVANVTKILTYALWGNNSGSNLLRGSLASCAGLIHHISFSADIFPSWHNIHSYQIWTVNIGSDQTNLCLFAQWRTLMGKMANINFIV